jgi:hypothetical protein
LSKFKKISFLAATSTPAAEFAKQQLLSNPAIATSCHIHQVNAALYVQKSFPAYYFWNINDLSNI